MTNFNIFSTGNGISLGYNIITPDSNTKLHDTWKKSKLMTVHPDNMYRSYADYIAQRLDATIYYIGNENFNIIKVANVFESNFNLIKKNFPNDINIHCINLCPSTVPSLYPTFTNVDHVFNESGTDNVKDKLKKIIASTAKNYAAAVLNEGPVVLKFINDVNNFVDYNNRVALIIPDFEKINYQNEKVPRGSNASPIEYKQLFEKNDWATIIDRDIKHILDYEDDHELDKFLQADEHKKLGEYVYRRLTNETKLLTI